MGSGPNLASEDKEIEMPHSQVQMSKKGKTSNATFCPETSGIKR